MRKSRDLFYSEIINVNQYECFTVMYLIEWTIFYLNFKIEAINQP